MLFRQVLNESVFLIVCHTLTVFYRSSKEGFRAQLLPLLFDWKILQETLFLLQKDWTDSPLGSDSGTENKIALNPRCYTQIYKFLFATKVRILNLSPKLSAYRHDTLQFGITQKVCKLDKKNSLYIQSPSYIYELQRREYLFGRTV